MSNRTVVPATEGFRLVEPIQGDDGPEGIAYQPIVAWVVDYEDEGDSHFAIPVVVQTLPSQYAIMTPEGLAIFPEDRDIEFGEDQEATIIATFRKSWEQDKTATAKQAETAR